MLDSADVSVVCGRATTRLATCGQARAWALSVAGAPADAARVLLGSVELVPSRDADKLPIHGDDDVAFLTLSVRVRGLGGKGGFGSLLRGTRSNKVIDTGDMRDLRGQRLRHVQQAERLAKWRADKARRDAEAMAATAASVGDQVAEKRWQFDGAEFREQEQQASSVVSRAVAVALAGEKEDKHADEEEEEEEEEDKEEEDEDEEDDFCLRPRKRQRISASTLSKDGGVGDTGDRAADDSTATSTATTSNLSVAGSSTPGSAPSPGTAATAAADQVPDIDWTEVKSPQDLHVFGLDALKAALRQRGAKCGGSLPQRADRLFALGAPPASSMKS